MIDIAGVYNYKGKIKEERKKAKKDVEGKIYKENSRTDVEGKHQQVVQQEVIRNAEGEHQGKGTEQRE